MLSRKSCRSVCSLVRLLKQVMFIWASTIVEFRKAWVFPSAMVSLSEGDSFIVSYVWGKDPILVVALGMVVNCPKDTTGES